MNLINVLLVLLVIGGGLFLVVFSKDYLSVKSKGELEKEGSLGAFSLTGFFVNFFDTLGIGGFAPMTAIFKQFKLVNDRIIPGTLNTAMCIPVIVEALIFIKEVKVESITLISMLIAAVLGAVIGAGIVAKLDEKKVQLGMALALGAVLIIMLAGKLGIMPSGGEAIALTGTKLIIAIIGNFILGALMTLGIGLYAPCMALVYALGLSPLVAFPIMMGSCAFLMPAASIRFIKENAYNRKGTFIITITGVVGVIIAAYLVKSLPLNILTWLVMVVIAYTATKLFLDAKKNN
ncbi:MAG: sulfite exporter TauE/SafE family protein [Fusobacteriaceae bacterium]